MAKDSLSALPLWKQFQEAAQKRGRNPVRLLSAYIRESLDIWEDQQQDTELQRDVQRSGYRETDAVEIVRSYRREKRARRAAS